MKDVSQLGTQYFDIPSKEVANHITKWLATLSFKERGINGWTDKNRRIFFTYPDNEYLFTSTEDDRSWEELYKYGMPKYLDNQISTPKITLTEDNIRDFYFDVNNQTEVDDALEILDKAGEVIYIKGLAFLYDSWRYIIYANGSGWKLSDNSIGNRSIYEDLVNLYKPSREQLRFNVSINGNLPNNRIVYVNDLVDEAMSLFNVGDSFLDLVHKKESKIISHKYSYYFTNDSLYVQVSNNTNDKTQRIYQEGKWANKINSSEETIKSNFTTSSKNIRDLKYPDVVHIQSEKEHAKIKNVHSDITDWETNHHYYLIGGGFSEKRKSYENSKYTIYEMDQIIIDTPVKEIETPNMDIFPGIKIGDIVVSLVKKDGCREIGDMFEVLPKSKNGILYYSNTNSYEVNSFRLATYEESEEYEKGIRNINNNVSPVETILEKANRMYPIGTKVKLLAGTDGVDAEGIIKEKFILYDNGSISYRGLPGYVYFSKSNEWAKIVKDNIEIGDYVTVISSVSYANDAQKLIGKTFKVTKKCPIDNFKSTFYVCGAKHQYPYLFPLAEGGIYEEDIRLARQDEINSLGYIPNTIVDTISDIQKSDVQNMLASINYNCVHLRPIPQNGIDLKCKSSKQYINTTIASIPTINKELKQKKQKFYF